MRARVRTNSHHEKANGRHEKEKTYNKSKKRAVLICFDLRGPHNRKNSNSPSVPNPTASMEPSSTREMPKSPSLTTSEGCGIWQKKKLGEGAAQGWGVCVCVCTHVANNIADVPA